MPRQIVGFDHHNYITKAMLDNQQEGGYRFESDPKELQGFREWDSISCALETKKFQANFNLQQMPGCCAVLVLSYIRVHPYSEENTDKVIELVEKAAYDSGFGSMLMAQVVPQYSKMFWKNEPWIKCLDRGWTPSDPFRNAKSGNLVVYLNKDLKQPHKRPELEKPIYARLKRLGPRT